MTTLFSVKVLHYNKTKSESLTKQIQVFLSQSTTQTSNIKEML